MGGGRIAVYGDSNCLDSSHMVTNCYWLLRKILEFTNRNVRDPILFSDSAKMDSPLHKVDSQLPFRRTDVNFSTYSAVAGKDLVCGRDSRFEVWGTKGYDFQVMRRNRKLPGYPIVDLERDVNTSAEKTNLKLVEMGTQWNYSAAHLKKKFNRKMEILGFLNSDEVMCSFLLLLLLNNLREWAAPFTKSILIY